MAMTMLRLDGGVAAKGIFSSFREWVTHCISNRSEALATLVTAIQVGREEGVLHVSYCSMEPWLAGQFLSGPLHGCAQCLLPQSEAHFLAISLLEEVRKKQTKKTNKKISLSRNGASI